MNFLKAAVVEIVAVVFIILLALFAFSVVRSSERQESGAVRGRACREFVVDAGAKFSQACARVKPITLLSKKWEVMGRLREEALFLSSPGVWSTAKRMLAEGKTRADLLKAGVCIEGAAAGLAVGGVS